VYINTSVGYSHMDFRNQDTVYWFRNYGRHNNQVTLETEQFPIGSAQLNK
jgi:hypothetical protein